METKKVTCASCDIKCSVLADVEDNQILRIRRDPDHVITPHSLCNKGAAYPDQLYHKDSLLYPLKSVGKRGEGKWARVSWDEAMDEIAERMKAIVNEHGPEAIAGTAGAIVPYDLTNRFLNLLGSPNFMAGTYLCLGNTSSVNRVTYGWQPFPDYWHGRTKVIVMWGHDPEATLHQYVKTYNHLIPQRALKHISPVQALKDWHAKKPELFKKRVYNQPGLDS